MSFNITPVASGYQEIHPYSAMNIDSVKINTSLLMMREWLILFRTGSFRQFTAHILQLMHKRDYKKTIQEEQARKP